jgi:hypothetical protein
VRFLIFLLVGKLGDDSWSGSMAGQSLLASHPPVVILCPALEAGWEVMAFENGNALLWPES